MDWCCSVKSWWWYGWVLLNVRNMDSVMECGEVDYGYGLYDIFK